MGATAKRSSKQKTTPRKTDRQITEGIMKMLSTSGGATATLIATKSKCNPQRVRDLCQQLVKRGELVLDDVIVRSKTGRNRAFKGYKLSS